MHDGLALLVLVARWLKRVLGQREQSRRLLQW